jgi:hypothetical protein
MIDDKIKRPEAVDAILAALDEALEEGNLERAKAQAKHLRYELTYESSAMRFAHTVLTPMFAEKQ